MADYDTQTTPGRQGESNRVAAANVPRILLLVHHDENRRLLVEWLSREYEVIVPDADGPLPDRFDLCLTDRRGYSRRASVLEEASATDTEGFVPTLLLTPQEAETLDPSIWDHVDEIIATPVQRLELRTRIEGLLERRRLFTSLEQRNRTIEALHDATRTMVRKAEPDAICQVAADAAARALDLPVTAVWLVDETGTMLEPAAASEGSAEVLGDPPTFSADAPSLAWDAYTTGETMAFDDLADAVDAEQLHNPDTSIRSEMIVPLDEFGVMVSGSQTPRSFDENDLQGIQLLASNTAAALGRAFREQRLARETSRLEFFASILRHDVLNGMTVIQARAAALARSLDDDEQRGNADVILEWSDEVVDVVERVRQVLDTLTGQTTMVTEPIDLAHVVEDEIATLSVAYPAVTFETDVPADLTVLADDLLSEVLGNVMANAIEHNDPSDLATTVTACAGEELATVRIADTGSGIPDDRKESIFRRGETGHAKSTGSGFGLFFVDSMVTEYDGSVHVEDNDPTGAVFVIELPLEGDDR